MRKLLVLLLPVWVFGVIAAWVWLASEMVDWSHRAGGSLVLAFPAYMVGSLFFIFPVGVLGAGIILAAAFDDKPFWRS